MARPKNKQELIEAANTNYEKLLSMIERRTEAEKSAPYDFLDDEKKKEAHWRRDRNLRDVLIHLNEWHLLLLEWVKNRENGSNKPFLLEGCNLLEYLTQRDIQTKNSGVNVRYRGKHRFFKGFNEFIKEKTRRCDNDFEKIERHVFF